MAEVQTFNEKMDLTLKMLKELKVEAQAAQMEREAAAAERKAAAEERRLAAEEREEAAKERKAAAEAREVVGNCLDFLHNKTVDIPGDIVKKIQIRTRRV